jgi:hypothetical protein
MIVADRPQCVVRFTAAGTPIGAARRAAIVRWISRSRRRIIVKKDMKSRVALKTGAAALALTFLASNAAVAMCAKPQEMAALRAAALRQELMVAALTCHETDDFNRFVTMYRTEYQASDHDLQRFFDREGSGDAGYNAYKTKEANNSSIESMHDPEFCGRSLAAFDVALHRNLPLADLATEEASYVHTGFEGCSRSADASSYVLTRVAVRADQTAKATSAVAYTQTGQNPYLVPAYYR